ncbi:hypothetical protein [Micromonospora sp. NPDC050200]|uniref:hypothetical protein n=1 Tax=Micromonospora sp. NPDC050200 TaxID=3155664 RepID=UPI0034098EDA
MATRRDGTKIYYRLAGPDVAALYALLRDVAGTRSAQAVDRGELQRWLAAGEVVAVDVRRPRSTPQAISAVPSPSPRPAARPAR